MSLPHGEGNWASQIDSEGSIIFSRETNQRLAKQRPGMLSSSPARSISSRCLTPVPACTWCHQRLRPPRGCSCSCQLD